MRKARSIDSTETFDIELVSRSESSYLGNGATLYPAVRDISLQEIPPFLHNMMELGNTMGLMLKLYQVVRLRCHDCREFLGKHRSEVKLDRFDRTKYIDHSYLKEASIRTASFACPICHTETSLSIRKTLHIL